MATPRQAISTLRPDIGMALEDFNVEGDLGQYIGYQVLPIQEVQLQRGTYPRIPLDELLQNADTLRSNKSGYNYVTWNFIDEPFGTSEHGLSSPVDDRLSAIYEDFFSMETETAKIIRGMLLREAERRVAAKVFNPTTFTSQTTPIDNEWDSNHTSDATPIDDVKAAQFEVYARTGIWPNALVLNRRVFLRLRSLDQITEAIQSGGAGSATKASDITAALLAQVFGLEKVLVAGGTHNLNDEGQEASIDQIWSDEYAMVTRVATSNSFSEPCLGRTLHWALDGSAPGSTIETFRNEDLRRDVVRVRHDVDEKILYPETAQLLSNITTAA